MSKESKNMTVPKLRFPEFSKDGEWEEKRLGEIGEPLMCKRIFKEQTTANPQNAIPFYKIGTFGREADSYISIDLYNDYKSKYSFPTEGDILISASGTIGRLVVYDGADAYFQDSNIVWLKNNEKSILNRFLFYCYSILRWQTSDGGVIQRLYNSDLKNIKIRYPQDLSEQQKIASCLSSLDDLITAENQKLEALKAHKKGLMQQLFPVNGQIKPILRFAEFTKDWEKSKIEDLIELQSGYPFQSEYFSNEGKKLVTPKNFTKNGHGSFDKENTKYTTEEIDMKYVCAAGDLLLLLTDLTPSCELLGKPLLLVEKDGEVLLNQRIVRVIPKARIEIPFLLYFFSSESYHKRIKDTATGSTVRHSSNRIVLNTQLFVPSISEQQKIASCLSSLDELITAQAEKIEALKEHKKGLMQGLFPGLNEINE